MQRCIARRPGQTPGKAEGVPSQNMKFIFICFQLIAIFRKSEII